MNPLSLILLFHYIFELRRVEKVRRYDFWTIKRERERERKIRSSRIGGEKPGGI